MKTYSLFCVLLVSLCATLPGVAQNPAAPDPAEKALTEIRTVASVSMTILNDRAAKTMPREQLESLFAASSELTIALGEKFLRDFPQDSRRWEAIKMMLPTRPLFAGAATEVRKAAWQKRRCELVAEVIASPEAPAEVVVAAASSELMLATQSTEGPDLARARVAVKLLADRAPDAPFRPMLERTFLEALQRVEPAEALGRARELASADSPEIAGMARNWISSVEYKTKPLDLKFPDLDEQEIDLAKYRGKVVLLDFWATWCVPCMEQMPHLVEAYEKYHAQGFEVIGITDDIPVRDPAKPRPVEKTIPALKEILGKHHMPWPQLWDLRAQKVLGPKGLLQQFGVRSLPTYLLFDKKGMFVTSDLKGDKLEAEIQRLLGQ